MKSTVVIIIVLVISFYVIYKNPFVSYNMMDDYYNKGGVLTTNIKNYKELFNQKVKYIKEKRNFLLDPADEEILNDIQNKINNTNDTNDTNDILTKLFIATLNMPGNTIGYTSMTPWDDPSKKICLQLEQGSSGWYWLYGTFPKTKDCFLYQLTRVDLLPTELRQNLGYKLGETTIYCLTLGIGDSKSYYYGNVYFEGSLIIKDNENFSIISKNTNIVFTHKFGKMSLFCKNIMLKNNENVKDEVLYNFECNVDNYFGMSLNQKNGCYPCTFSNNSYQSYTNLYVNMYYNNNKGVEKKVKNGNGWMDHEWGGGLIGPIFYKLFLPILQKGKVYKGLPPYIWLNLRISDNLQYMLYSFFSSPPKKGDVISCSFNKYQPSGVSFSTDNPTVNVKIVDTLLYEGVEYPIIYKVDLDGNTYILNSKAYGKTIFRDLCNTNHWGGSCDIFNQDKQVGVGFIEAQRFDKSVDSLRDTFLLLGYKDTDFANKYNDTTYKSQLYTTYVIFLLFLILFIVLVYRFIKHVYNYTRTYYVHKNDI
jgi:hypothetical protein